MVCTQGAFLSIRKERRKGAVIFAAAGWPPGYVRGLPRALLAAKGKGGVCSLPADAAADGIHPAKEYTAKWADLLKREIAEAQSK